MTLADLATQMYFLEYEPKSTGTQVIQININGQPASMSPVVLEVEEPPIRSTNCPLGYASNDDGQCNPCPAGTASPGGTARCRPCDPGTKQPLQGQSSCDSCPVGEYQPNFAALSCIACKPGTSSRGKTGSQACSPCEPGQEAPINGSERCTPCKRGFYSELEGQAECLQCTGGKSTTEQALNTESS